MNIEIIENNETNGFIIYKSQYVVENLRDIIYECNLAQEKFKAFFPGANSTQEYNKYNIFSLTSTSLHFYNIYRDFIFCVKDFLSKNNLNSSPAWFQAWLNFHKQKEVLDWHNHGWPYHGYLSIDPKKSRTVFENFSINNEPGLFYFGRGYRKHKVEVLTPFTGNRITLGYDLKLKTNSLSNISVFPVL